MKRKYISKTYMRGVSDWDIVISKRKLENYYLCIKRINEVDESFTINRFGKSILFIDNGYYVVEFTPLNQFYNARAYLDKNADIIGYYFDITYGNGVEENIPYYDDLYLDIIYYPNGGSFIKVEDENELIEALDTQNITKEQFDLAKKVCSNLVKEIQSGKNIFVNMDKKKLVQKYFM